MNRLLDLLEKLWLPAIYGSLIWRPSPATSHLDTAYYNIHLWLSIKWSVSKELQIIIPKLNQFPEGVNQARVNVMHRHLIISERPLSTQSYSASGLSVPLCFPLQRLSLTHPHWRNFVSLYFFDLTLVPRVLMGLLELLGVEHNDQPMPFFPDPLC